MLYTQEEDFPLDHEAYNMLSLPLKREDDVAVLQGQILELKAQVKSLTSTMMKLHNVLLQTQNHAYRRLKQQQQHSQE